VSDLAKRAVACKGWKWMPGMKAQDQASRKDGPCSVRVYWTNLMMPDLHVAHMGGNTWSIPKKADTRNEALWRNDPTALPDFTDPATVGCLWSIVWELPRPAPDHPVVRYLNEALYLLQVCGPLDVLIVEQLVAALEAAP
jgi:hypothetical protein